VAATEMAEAGRAEVARAGKRTALLICMRAWTREIWQGESYGIEITHHI
jgi:hypothetical protein